MIRQLLVRVHGSFFQKTRRMKYGTTQGFLSILNGRPAPSVALDQAHIIRYYVRSPDYFDKRQRVSVTQFRS